MNAVMLADYLKAMQREVSYGENLMMDPVYNNTIARHVAHRTLWQIQESIINLQNKLKQEGYDA